ncbi:hypothetical protein BDV96DRAFT_85120 [Lophiotrema nucula]|uniref:Uncharacterized protein n=1 Tax=Lophiotrema nucula TaxID=690887 RepID=A0A6A5Z6L4_9PLEO|nr:hypothetical protein BDV96DRAFT_85120 [Lophiotrema nucula]
MVRHASPGSESTTHITPARRSIDTGKRKLSQHPKLRFKGIKLPRPCPMVDAVLLSHSHSAQGRISSYLDPQAHGALLHSNDTYRNMRRRRILNALHDRSCFFRCANSGTRRIALHRFALACSRKRGSTVNDRNLHSILNHGYNQNATTTSTARTIVVSYLLLSTAAANFSPHNPQSPPHEHAVEYDQHHAFLL